MSSSQDFSAKLRKMVKVSTRMTQEQMRGILKMSAEDFNDRILDWAEEFGFKIDGDSVNFAGADMDAFIQSLDDEFATWGKSEQTGSGKISQRTFATSSAPPQPEFSDIKAKSSTQPPSMATSPARQKCEYLLQAGQIMMQKGQYPEAIDKLKQARQTCDDEVFDATLLQNIEDAIAGAEQV